MASFTYFGIFRSGRIPVDVQQLIIDESVDVLPDEVCRQRQQLLQIVFPSHLLHIGDRVFDRCTALLQVALPSRLTSIGEYAFHQCMALTDVSLPEGLEKIGMQSFSECSALQRIKVPSTVKIIGHSAFSHCHALAEVILLEGLVNIGSFAFFSCFLLREIKVPQTVVKIESCAFSRCKSLVDIGLPPRTQLLSHAFSDCASLEKVQIPPCNSIPDGLFTGCSSLTDVRLNEGLTRIGSNSFADASSLVKVNLPSTTRTIAYCAFSGCVCLEEVGISEGLTAIGHLSFRECSSLARIRVPSTVTKIDEFAFSECIRLVSVEFSSTRQLPLRIGNEAFHNCHSLANIAIPLSESDQDHILTNILDGCNWLIEVYGGALPSQILSDRFDKFPVHEKCYHSCNTTLKELRLELDGCDKAEWTQGTHSDLFGMTPFHVLLSAASCRLDLLDLLLQTYPSHVLDWRDDSGNRAIDYLSSIWNEETRALMQSYLQKWLIDRLSGWGLNEWRSDMARRVRDIVVEEDRERRYSFLRDAYHTVKRCERVETMALLELALWKNDMVCCSNGASLRAVPDREGHRAKCGTTFVVPNVISFLAKVDSE